MSSSAQTARPCLASAASELHFSSAPPEETPLHTMLFLPAAALCCLCSALVAITAGVIQRDFTLTKRVGETVSFSCERTHLCEYVHWIQKKGTETFRVILRIQINNGAVHRGYNHPQTNDFSAVNKGQDCELKINNIKSDHSASYYCYCANYRDFGSGTKLFVTEQQVVKPVVSVYPAASRDPLKNHLLCVASAMFPPEVQFSWKRLKQNGGLEKLNSREGEQLELRESGHSTAILVLKHYDPKTKYRCSVKHQGGTVEAETEQVIKVTAPPSTAPPPPPTLPPSTPPTSTPPPPPPAVPPPHWYRERLLCLQYTVLIVKSVVYCFGLSLMMILRNKGPSTSSTHAD
ncbi:uncharacterized protein LOC115405693 [Salarias fasciatus]|uniref:uncharacterized protein LOC115405693 n=1 Tax=Salarias fasciatus TaxID=181472 RepID=UPI00117699DF|nr:uncharacterized protein LOC115405693 [Salarias fasciatus]